MSYVEFYFPGVSLAGSCEREVPSRDVSNVKSYPDYAYAYRFFDKDEAGNKVNFSNYHYIGEEYSEERYKLAFPQCNDLDCNRIVRLVTGGFLALQEDDVVVA